MTILRWLALGLLLLSGARAAMAGPTLYSAIPYSGTQINIAWGDTDGANSSGGMFDTYGGNWVIYHSTDGISWTQAGTAVPAATNFADTGLSPLTTYYYFVTAYFAGCTGCEYAYGSSNVVSGTTYGPPAVPSGLSAVPASTTQINLSWTDNSSNEVGFAIERKVGAGGTFSLLDVPAANVTTYSDTGLTSGTTYYYRIYSYGYYGYSAYSNVASTAPYGPPNAPSSLSATTVSGSRIDLAWTDNSSNEVGFAIERKIGAGGTYSLLDVPDANVTTYSDTGLTSGTTYYYRVYSYGYYGTSSYSNESHDTTTGATTPTAPSVLSATAASAAQINLAWTDNSSNETGFKVERKTGSGGTYAQVATPAANATSYNDTGLTANTTYYYRVRATNAAGDSSYTSDANATTGDTIYYIYPDQLGTPRLIQDQSGTAVWIWANDDPFGNNPPNENPSSLGTFTFNPRYPGQYADKETNQHYNYFRDSYNSYTGGYGQSDPIGLIGGINTYVYAKSSPINYVDPSGLQVPPLTSGGAIGGLGGLGGFVGRRMPSGNGSTGDPDLDRALGIPNRPSLSFPILTAPKSSGESKGDSHHTDAPTANCPDPCGDRAKQEMLNCSNNYGKIFGWDHFIYQGCKERTRIREDLCRRNISDMPPAWSDADVNGWRPPVVQPGPKIYYIAPPE